MAVDRPGHFRPVDCVAQHAAAQLVASGDVDGVVLLWDRGRGRFLRSLIGHAGAITDLAFHPDGSRLASASVDGTVMLWTPDGQRVWTYRDAKASTHVTRLAFDPTGSALLAGTSDGRLLRCDARTGRGGAVTTVDEAFRVAALAVSPDGKRAAAASARGRIGLWDIDLSRRRLAWDAGAGVDALVFPGTDGLVATGGRQVQFWDAVSGALLMRQDVSSGPVQALEIDRETGDLVIADQGNQLTVLNLGDLQQQLRGLNLELLVLPYPKTREHGE